MKQTTVEQEELPTSRAVVVREPDAMAVASPTPAQMLQEMIRGGVKEENVAAFGKLIELSERMEDRNAAKEFAAAFKLLQAAIPNVKATKPVPDGKGGIKFHYAPPEEIMRQVQPHLTAHGFTLSFSQRLGEGTVTSICTLMHDGGHSKANEFTVRSGKGPYGGTERDADVAAGTVAQREALCDCLNIVRTHLDTDPRMLGDKITKEEAAELKRRVQATGSSEPDFLKFAGADSYENIPKTALPRLDSTLKRKESTR